jgi:Gram-negative bacterial TonB protein C-terminal
MRHYLTILISIAAVADALAQDIPETRPALIGRSPGAIINRIDTRTLMAANQKASLVFFFAKVEKTGDVTWSASYLGAPDSQLLAQEVDRALVGAKMIPAIRNREPVAVLFYGAVVFSVVEGKPRLRLFANQDAAEIKKESDFIAPQACLGGDSKLGALSYPQNGSPVPLSAIVNLQLAVDAAGNLQNVKVIDESPPLLGYGDAALIDFNSAKYVPAFREGKPVASDTTLSIYYPQKG